MFVDTKHQSPSVTKCWLSQSSDKITQMENTPELSSKYIKGARLQIELLQKSRTFHFFRDFKISQFRLKSAGFLNKNIRPSWFCKFEVGRSVTGFTGVMLVCRSYFCENICQMKFFLVSYIMFTEQVEKVHIS